MSKKITLKEKAKIKREIKAEIKSKKLQKIDGLGAYEKRKIRNALRDVWRYTLAHKLVKKRCTGGDGFMYCQQCNKRTPKLFVDHIKPIGEVDRGFIERLFVPSFEMQGLCDECHQPKTNKENKTRRARKKAIKSDVGDFF